MTNYRVVAEAAHVKVDGGLRLVYKGALVPDGQDEVRLRHLLASKLIAPVDEVEVPPNAAVVPDGFATTGGQRVKPEAGQPESGESETDRKRAAAKAKLPADGSAPDGRASQEVWVEYAVARGLDRGEAEKATREDLKKALQQ